ncbi:MAG: hypothetical protein DHS20C13_15210 [Thermodesulfobacteriota bacterium]|nr:MAG: hypothetical protein DHS20C13_15210 [Thermodesulfobacteriota bacterium]
MALSSEISFLINNPSTLDLIQSQFVDFPGAKFLSISVTNTNTNDNIKSSNPDYI